MSGPFYFAWVAPGTAFNPAVHNVNDEKIVSWFVEHLEGEFCSFTIRIKNPRIGLLNAGRKRWAFLSWDNGSEIVGLFSGRLIAAPSNLQSEIVQLSFVARPLDYAAQKEALAATLRVLPYYDPVFIAPDKALDPDTVLEARTAAWHIDRMSPHVVSISDFIQGDSTLEFAASDFTYADFDVQCDQPPIRKVKVTASVSWDQVVAGDGLQLLKNYNVTTVAGKGLIGGWPEAGKTMSGGWNCTESRAASLFDKYSDRDFGVWMGDLFRVDGPPFAVKVVESFSSSLGDGTVDATTTYFCVLNGTVVLDLKMGYAGKRKRSDIVTFELVAESQPILTDPDDDEVLELTVHGNDVGLPLVAEANAIPVGDVQRRSYFAQDRGVSSLKYLLQLARANIIMRARAVRITFKCLFPRAVELSLRKNVHITSSRLPGGEATGKIVGYAFKAEGGEISGFCTIACAIGYGGVWTELTGTPVYANAGYAAPGYQVYTGKRILAGASDVAFYPLVEAPNDDGLVFPLTALPVSVAPHVVTVETIPLVPVPPTSTAEVKIDDCGGPGSTSLQTNLDTGPYTSWLGGVQTTVNFTLPPITGGPFDSVYVVVCETMKIPKQIDLEAASI